MIFQDSPTRTSVSEGGRDVTPRPTDSTGEFEDSSDEVEELCRSELKCLRVPEEQAPLKRIGCARRSDLYRASGEDTGDIREGYTESKDQGVQNAME